MFVLSLDVGNFVSVNLFQTEEEEGVRLCAVIGHLRPFAMLIPSSLTALTLDSSLGLHQRACMKD
jgi:hypothetical protein